MKHLWIALPLLLGALAALGFTPFALWPLTLVAAAALLWLIDAAPTGRRAFGLGWWFGLGHFVLGFNWIATAFTYQAAMPPALGWLAVVGVAALMALYPALSAWGAWRLGRGLASRSLWFAALWMLTEWLRGHLLSGFAWNPLGAVWLPLSPLAGAAAWVGAIGLSGLVWVVASALALLVRSDRLRQPATLVAPLLLIAAVAGWALRAPLPAPTSIRLALVQPNIGQGSRYADPNANLAQYAALTTQAFAAGAQVVIWPEGALQFTLEEDPAVRAYLAGMIPQSGLLLFGSDHIERDADGVAVGARNSLFALDERGTIHGRYDKAHLVPLGEYLPFRPLMTPLGLARLVPGELDFWEGPGPQTLHLPGLPPMGVQICYEIIFPARVIDGRDRPAWLLTISNDAWFGGDGPPQHFAQARLRAIEEGLPVVRVTPTGISGFIDARGGVSAKLPQLQVGVLHGVLPSPLPPTLFARFGHGTTLVFGLLLAGLALLAGRHGGQRKLDIQI
ncbi:apolipoprotein N-acyltransferase [Polymorphobacter arshaanensis]|uniref:Apolipoprotein N-acyltransferase n=1 Tax=Glacieibacterium arshaanense TaxID=2511025 RepID=A0A4Y9EQM9_9SPHN|nr:apolipoprotein N-acyltransferase [Polymorphobacter arshaanensis]TFU03659.1 apolipoprotein N-acyltransferase [Polymorphobacter arshaanensis]